MTMKLMLPKKEKEDSVAAAGGAISGNCDDTTTTTSAVAALEGAVVATNNNNSNLTTAINSPSSTYLGIDFGTTNSAAAIWDSFRGHPKWMRLGRHELATREKSSSNKAGRIVPSAVLFVSKTAAIKDGYFSNNQHYEDVSAILGRGGRSDDDDDDDDDVVAFVGAAAMKIAEQASLDNTESSFPYTSEQVSRALVTSVKRILGMKRRNSDDNNKDDNDDDKEWIESLPFELVVMNDKTKMEDDDANDDDDTVSIRVYPLGMMTTTTSNNSITVTPEQVVAIILRSIRLAAQEYLQENMVKKRLQIPGGAWQCTNCVLGVPANFGQAQRQTLLRAARLAGFDNNNNSSNNHSNNNNGSNDTRDGMEQQQQQLQQQHGVKVVSVLTESTAAAMAYGLFVSAAGAKRTNNNNENGTTTTTTSILVFDMGGGTTDVTIAEMSTAATDAANVNSDESLLPRFEVKVTHGNAHLGGDDMDEALLRTVLTKLSKQQGGEHDHASSSSSLSPLEHRSLLRQCRSAKERLCGDVDHGLTKPEECVTITIASTGTKRIAVDITQQDLSKALQPCLERAEQVVQTALDRYAAMLPPSTTTSCESSEAAAESDNAHSTTPRAKRRPPISEVVLVGGATRVLGVRDMLLRLFPPPPDLCLSVNAMSAVAQGTAIKAAMDSKCIPLHELRSAMMLDTTPHAIGVLLDNNDNNQHNHHDNKDETTPTTTLPRRFVEIIPRDDPLPASGVATFQLADARQPGISLTAVEEVVELIQRETKEEEGGGGCERRRRLLYPKLGDFTFLLHRLSEQQIAQLKDGIRSVDICMTLKENGELVVSFFDANDPEHVARHQKQQQQQQQQKKRRSKRDNASALTSAEAVLEYAPSNDGDDMNNDMDDNKDFSKDQLILIAYCIVLMVLYVAAKLVFHEELKRFNEE